MRSLQANLCSRTTDVVNDPVRHISTGGLYTRDLITSPCRRQVLWQIVISTGSVSRDTIGIPSVKWILCSCTPRVRKRARMTSRSEGTYSRRAIRSTSARKLQRVGVSLENNKDDRIVRTIQVYPLSVHVSFSTSPAQHYLPIALAYHLRSWR